jgi:hypothetical protein
MLEPYEKVRMYALSRGLLFQVRMIVPGDRIKEANEMMERYPDVSLLEEDDRGFLYLADTKGFKPPEEIKNNFLSDTKYNLGHSTIVALYVLASGRVQRVTALCVGPGAYTKHMLRHRDEVLVASTLEGIDCMACQYGNIGPSSLLRDREVTIRAKTAG